MMLFSFVNKELSKINSYLFGFNTWLCYPSMSVGKDLKRFLYGS